MRKLKTYITKANKDFKIAKKALDSARTAALKIARSHSEIARSQSECGHRKNLNNNSIED